MNEVEQNPAELLCQPRSWQNLPGILAVAEIERLLSAPKRQDTMYLRNVALLELLYGGGLRASELANLDQEYGVLRQC